jgi:hypothetical protein
MVCWIRKSPDDEAATIVNVNNALRFAWFHGIVQFEELRREFIVALSKAGIRATIYDAYTCAKFYAEQVEIGLDNNLLLFM